MAVAQRLQRQRRFQIEHAIAQAIIGAGRAIMHLVGMDYDDIAGHAMAPFAAIPERLHAVQRHADRIGVMPVQIIGIPGEPRFDAFKARIGRRRCNRVLHGKFAQTSKTTRGLFA